MKKAHDMPASNAQVTWVSPEQLADIIARSTGPRKPNAAMQKLMRDFMLEVADGNIMTDTTSPQEAGRWLREHPKAEPEPLQAGVDDEVDERAEYNLRVHGLREEDLP